MDSFGQTSVWVTLMFNAGVLGVDYLIAVADIGGSWDTMEPLFQFLAN